MGRPEDYPSDTAEPARQRVGGFEVVKIDRPAAGGDGLGHLADGRVVFVTGALPGERVEIELDRSKRDYAHGHVREVVEASPERVVPRCPNVARGCGGCDQQHLDVRAQPTVKRDVVVDALRRLGQIEDPEVLIGAPLPAESFRTTLRVAILNGRAGFRRRASHEVIPVRECLVAHPAIEELLGQIDFAGASEAVLRLGSARGERLVVVDPSARGIEVPEGTVLVGQDDLDGGVQVWVEEKVLGETLRVSARSFFQTRPDGAERLVATVFDAIAAHVGPGTSDISDGSSRPGESIGPGGSGRSGGSGGSVVGIDRLVDAYGGVGLFSAAATGPAGLEAFGGARQVVSIERNPSSVADARHNLRDRPVAVVEGDVDAWGPSPADVVIADPSRQGLGRDGVAVLAGTGAPLLVLVSCDGASLGRDAKLLEQAGYRFERSIIVDLFPHTHHVEVVSTFTRPTQADRNRPGAG